MIFLYNHGGSENHGCEALVRTVSSLLRAENKLTLLSETPQQDFYYGLNDLVNIESAIHPPIRFSLDFIKAYFHLKRTGDFFEMDVLPYRESIRNLRKEDVEISIGGDIYCYEDYPKYIKLHDLICQKGCKSVLLGCSLDEKLFKDSTFVDDLNKYSYISARESITFNYLKNAGLSNIGYAPDTAFLLPVENLPLPNGFQEKNTVGINLSPLASEKESIPGITLDNYRTLIRSILDNTDCSIVLIPHVIWKGNDDREILKQLLNEFGSSERIVIIQDYNCMQLKGFISKCRIFVGARTHATIAAYSTGVPTLVLGYSVKSRGIAKDLFGSDEHYVVPVQKLNTNNDLTEAFWWLWDHEAQIRSQLDEALPEYVSRIYSVKDNIQDFVGKI